MLTPGKDLNKKELDTRSHIHEEFDFTAKLIMHGDDDVGSVYSYNCLTNVRKLGEDEFVIGKKSGNKFIESKISGNKKEILEIADFINRANNILENSGGVSPIFKIDEKGTLVVESKQISNYGRDGEEYDQPEYVGDLCQKIIDSVMRNALPEHSVIKKNITPILEFLNA